MSHFSDRTIRHKMFVMTLVGIGFIVALGGIFEHVFSYSILKQSRIKFGSYGFYLAHFPSGSAFGQKKKIVLLGNSVYQYSEIPKHMQRMADQDKHSWALLNMSQISSTIYDYLLQTAKVVSAHPDLIVVCLNEGTFSLEPKFKTDAPEYAFDADVKNVLPSTFYRRYFNYKTGIDARLSALLPLKRLDPIIRWRMDLRGNVPEHFLKWLSYPYLNIQTKSDQHTVQMTLFKQGTGNEQYIVLNELLDIVQERKIPVLFIWQEASWAGENELYRRIKSLIQVRPNALFVDLSQFWSQEKYRDSIHPNSNEEPRYAQRHYHEIVKAMGDGI